MNTEEREREAFEAWAANEHGGNRVGRDVDGLYSSDAGEHDWKVWQASSTHHMERIGKLEGALRFYERCSHIPSDSMLMLQDSGIQVERGAVARIALQPAQDGE